MLLLLFLLFVFGQQVHSEIAFYGRVPNGINPTLYDVKNDQIIQLDEMTFNDTVYCAPNRDDCSAFIVEFYSDWCGQCRLYANTFKALAEDVKEWEYVTKVAAINCADSNNEAVCNNEGIGDAYPYIRYYPRRATPTSEKLRLKLHSTMSVMRDEITKILINDKTENWPNFVFLNDMNTYSELWAEIPPTINKLAVVFEKDEESLLGAQVLLDLSRFNDELIVRRCLKSHALVEALHITEFPSIAIFKRGEKTPIRITDLRKLLFKSVSDFMTEEREAKLSGTTTTTQAPVDCAVNPELCRKKYYVSELDMLKAARYTLLMEVGRTGDNLSGETLTAVKDFIDLLIDNLPLNSITETPGVNSTLAYSHYAVAVLKKVKTYLDERKDLPEISLSEYQNEFAHIESEFFNPFPVNDDWEHCAGSDSQFRGYTCGLWTLFHALTVQAYKNGFGSESFSPLKPLNVIRNWIVQFFGCKFCREHFAKMTTKTFQMESHVTSPEDVYVYLWKAHNIINARLRGRDTEDPEFPKYQFPPVFLCPRCSKNGVLDETAIKNFLVDYYSFIKPYRKTSQASSSFVSHKLLKF